MLPGNSGADDEKRVVHFGCLSDNLSVAGMQKTSRLQIVMNRYIFALACCLGYCFTSDSLWARDYTFDPGRQTVISTLAAKNGITVYWLQSTSGDPRCTYQVELRNTNSYPVHAIVHIVGEILFLGRDNDLYPISAKGSEFVCIGETRKRPTVSIASVTKD